MKTVEDINKDLREEQEARARTEHAAWMKLTELLHRQGALTAEDLSTSVMSRKRTPGLAILRALRDWGDAKGKLHTINVIARG
jgi:hypothetical protein